MAVNRRKARDRGEACSLLDEWSTSGLELRAFCRRRGIDGRSLHCWRLNLRDSFDEASPAPIRLVEVRPTRPLRASHYQVTVGEVVIQVDDDFHDDTLARILRLAAAC